MHPCTVHGSQKLHFLTTFSLKVGLTTLFRHLKILLLQYFQFQFLISAKISCIQTDPKTKTHDHQDPLSLSLSLSLITIVVAKVGEIIEISSGPRHLSTILLKNFHLFKIAKSVINFRLKNFSN